jgi:thiamine pyrophosphate-dependent acetolactate synthase large subunit-like protein
VGSQGEIGKGSFQELNQVEAVRQFCKYAGRATSVRDIGPIITAAVKASFNKHKSLGCQGSNRRDVSGLPGFLTEF